MVSFGNSRLIIFGETIKSGSVKIFCGFWKFSWVIGTFGTSCYKSQFLQEYE